MATNQPKVQGYVPESVYKSLQDFKGSRGLNSMSEAVSVALQEYFGLDESSVNQGESLIERVNHIEGKS